LRAGTALVVLAPQADVVTSGNLLVGAAGSPCGKVLGGSGGEVLCLGEKRHRPRTRVVGMRLVHDDGIASLADDAAAHLFKRVTALTAAGLKVVDGRWDHGSGLHSHPKNGPSQSGGVHPI
jgi:hypothetical protein